MKKIVRTCVFCFVIVILSSAHATASSRSSIMNDAEKLDSFTRRTGSGGCVTTSLLRLNSLKYPVIISQETVEYVGGEKQVVSYRDMVADHFLCKLTEKSVEADLLQLCQKYNCKIMKRFQAISGLYLIKLNSIGVHFLTQALTNFINEKHIVKYAEPDFLNYLQAVEPNDPYYYTQWNLSKVQAEEGWATQTGDKDTVVAVIDSGIAYNHPDLKDNMWVNNGEIPDNGIDDDKNGYVDDYYGYDFYSDDSDPDDVNGHGTLCAGIIGAVTDNSLGVAGVSWKVRLMAVRISGYQGNTYNSVIVDAVNYAAMMNVPISSNSYGSYSYSLAVYEAVKAACDGGQVFVASAGNSSLDNDSEPFYPASFDCGNIISVAATGENDDLSTQANYGATTVDLGAPGDNILSTYLNNGYEIASGSSMAAPMVSGTCALLASSDSTLSGAQIKARVLNSVDKIVTLNGKCVSNGRLNINKALNGYINIETPNGGEDLLKGDVATITWDSFNIEGTVKIELYKNGSLVQVIANAAENTGSYNWTVDNSLENAVDYKIKITAAGNASSRQSFYHTYIDESDNNFSIGSATGSLTVGLSPADAGSVYPSGSQTVITNGAVAIYAVPVTGKRFSGWTTSGDVSVTDANSPSTSAVLTGNTGSVTAVFADATVYLSENFSSGSTVFPPAGWSVIDGSRSYGETNDDDPHWHYGGSSNAACSAGYNHDEWLITPEINLSSATNPYLSYAWAGRYIYASQPVARSHFYVKISSDGGESWTELWDWQNVGEWKDASYNTSFIDLSSYVDKGSIKLAFQYYTEPKNFNSYALLTNIQVQDNVTKIPTGLEVVADPFNGGTVSPTGSIAGYLGEGISIKATAAEGYSFKEWYVIGNASIADAGSAETSVIAYNTSSVYALFTNNADSGKVELGIFSDPVSALEEGCVIMPKGVIEINPEKYYNISATPGEHYKFGGWDIVEGDVQIVNTNELSTLVYVYRGNAVIKAKFEPLTCDLTLITSPANGGTIDPEAGNYILYQGDTLTLNSVTPIPEYEFIGWKVEGDATSVYEDSGNTLVKALGSSATVKAVIRNIEVFKDDFESGNLSNWTQQNMTGTGEQWQINEDKNLSHNGNNSVFCAAGTDINTYLVSKELDLSKIAQPVLSFWWNSLGGLCSDGLYIRVSTDNGVSWSTPLLAITDSDEFMTSTWHNEVVDLSAYAGEEDVLISFQVVTNLLDQPIYLDDINVSAFDSAATLSVGVTPEGAGTTSVSGDYTVALKVPVEIAATANAGFYFRKWLLVGDGFVEDPYSASTNVTLYDGNATLTAEFVDLPVINLAFGSVFEVNATDVDSGLTEFIYKPKVTAVYNHPTSGKLTNAAFKVVTKVNAKNPVDTVNAEWIKKPRLIERERFFELGERLSDYLKENEIDDLRFDSVTIVAKENSSVPVESNNAFYLVNPIINEISKTVDTVTVYGRFFGSNPPQVYLEYQRPNEQRWRYKRLRGIRVRTNVFTNAKGKQNKSCMKVFEDDAPLDKNVGYSSIVVQYPRTFQYGATAKYLILDNGYSLTYFKYSTSD